MQVSGLVLMKLPAVYWPEGQLAYMKRPMKTNKDWVNQHAKNVETDCQERIINLLNEMVILRIAASPARDVRPGDHQAPAVSGTDFKDKTHFQPPCPQPQYRGCGWGSDHLVVKSR